MSDGPFRTSAPGDADPAAEGRPDVLVFDPLPRPGLAVLGVLARFGYRARAAAWDSDHLPEAPAVLIAARGDGSAAAGLVRRCAAGAGRPLVIVTVTGFHHPALPVIQAAGPDAVLQRPLAGPLVVRALVRRIPTPPAPAGRPLALTDDPGPALVLDSLRMVESAQAGTADQLLGTFLADLDQIEADIAEALARDDRPLAGALAHRIRGGAASIGAVGVAAAAARLEAAPGPGSDGFPCFMDQARAVRDAVARLRGPDAGGEH
jgi:HPt (histidine-containing phosphotransfer) domain-containing protein